jgi:hypothetical protein
MPAGAKSKLENFLYWNTMNGKLYTFTNDPKKEASICGIECTLNYDSYKHLMIELDSISTLTALVLRLDPSLRWLGSDFAYQLHRSVN